MNLLERLKPEFNKRLTDCEIIYKASADSISKVLENNIYVSDLTINDAADVMLFLTDNRYLDVRGIYELFNKS